MITVNNVSLDFSGQKLFSDVNLLFNAGECYGVIGANGAGKSTFLKILSGQLDIGFMTLFESQEKKGLEYLRIAKESPTLVENIPKIIEA